MPQRQMRHRVSTAELERRWAAIRAGMVQAGLDAILVQSKEDWMNGYSSWFTGQPATNAYPRSVLFPLEGLMCSVEVGDFGKTLQLEGADKHRPGVGKVMFVPSFNGSVNYTGHYDAELMAGEIKRLGHSRVGLACQNGMYHGFVSGLGSRLSDVEFVDASDLIDGIKAIKSPEEIAMLGETAKIQDVLFANLLEYIRPGLKEYEVTARIEYEGNLLGSCQGVYFCTSGKSAPLVPVNRYMQSRTIERDDAVFVLIENNGPGGMYCKLGRHITMGKAGSEMQEALERNLAAQRHALGLLAPGAACSDVFERHNEYMRSEACAEEKRLFAHGQGYEMVERPLIRRDENMVLRPNMNLCVHPGGTVRVMDNYIVSANGSGPCLHTTAKKIFEVD